VPIKDAGDKTREPCHGTVWHVQS